MKNQICSVLFFFALTSFASMTFANTELVQNKDVVTITGTSKQSMIVSALVYYVPAYKYQFEDVSYEKQSKIESACSFSEDVTKATGNDVAKNISTKVSENGTYSVSFALTAMRGKCPYVLETTYLNFKDLHVFEQFNLHSDASINRQNNLNRNYQMTFDKFAEQKEMYCDYSSNEEVNLCVKSDGAAFDSVDYRLEANATTYHFDVHASKPIGAALSN